ncbi:MAG: glycosyltransferase [Planctomycetales bacterium]|nr:glycosyltransferase [Planctomycetales bacterium]
MLIDWTHWISSLHRDQWIAALAPLLLFDSPRYALSAIAVWLHDFVRLIGSFVTGAPRDEREFTHVPSVCVVVAGLNEAKTLGATLRSLDGAYPKLQIIVVDDGSSDGMSKVASAFARGRHDVQVITRPRRGGKSSALNHALPLTSAEILVCVDSDSHLEPAALWEIVQPFRDRRVGAVSGNVGVRNAFSSLASWLQTLEYLRCIFLGRRFSAGTETLGIVSGAFGAFRTDIVRQLGGWDVGPGEDGDLTLRIRKAGYRIEFAPYAECRTNVPTTFRQLLRQRRRWEWAVVTFECRKHADMANLRSANFRWSNLLLLLDRWTFNMLLQFAFWSYLVWLALHPEVHIGWLFVLDYLVFLALDVIQHGIILYFSNHRRRDACLGLAIPVMPFYYLLLRVVLIWAVLEEMFTRRSYRDSFVPEHVRNRTWHW